MRRLWLLFAQTVTVAAGLLLVVGIFRPEYNPFRKDIVQIKEVAATPVSGNIAASYSTAVKKAVPSVVNIFTSKEVAIRNHPLMEDPLFRRFFGDQFNEQPENQSSLGSGVIVSANGYILTNHHVVEAADQIEVAFADGKSVSARVVGSDPETDLAVLKVELQNLPAITFGQVDQAKVGDVVLAIGNPFGVGQTVTMGIVSALERSHLGINTFENFIQTDAAINPGNSGGALVDVSGNLVGINSAIFSRTGGSLGIGFAIPGNLAKQVMEQIIQHGNVVRGWIGVEVQDITPELAESFKLPTTNGALIAGVLQNGPAARAGMKPGDILTQIGGKPVEDTSSMLNLISALQPNTTATIRVLRNQKEIDLQVTVGKRPSMRQLQSQQVPQGPGGIIPGPE